MKVTDEMAADASVKSVDTSPERDKKGDDSLHDERVEVAERAYRVIERLYMIERQERVEAEAAIARVRAVHQPVECDRHEGCTPSCEICFEEWPCPTIQALDGAPEPEEKP